ncbi:MAG: ABC transporter ATP-binding protein [Firmicutes bacterium]|nr:ABC transporter ATP-binding protein [Bacillota bacterium]
MIKLEDLRFEYEKGLPVIDGVSLEIKDGESVGLIGPNGAGKSTLFMLMLGLLSGSGSISADGIELSKKTLPQIREKMGLLMQNSDDQMFMPTVYEDLVFAPKNYGLSDAETEERVKRVLSGLGIEYLRDRHNHKISGGEKRLAAIATLLVMEPSVLLMDEPTNALDPANRRLVINTVKALPQTKLIASHDLDMVWDCCERVVLLSGGRVAADGPREEILRDRELLEANHLELPLKFQ